MSARRRLVIVQAVHVPLDRVFELPSGPLPAGVRVRR